jgi:hypothetical protein
MHPTNIFFLRCSNSDRLKSEGLRECPLIVLPRNSSLGTYNLHKYQPAKDHPARGEKDAPEPAWPFRFVCTHCEHAFDYSVGQIEPLAHAQEEYGKLVQWSVSKRFWQLEIITESEPRKYPRCYVYTISAKDRLQDLVRQDVLRIDPPASTYVGLKGQNRISGVSEIKIIAHFDYDFLD